MRAVLTDMAVKTFKPAAGQQFKVWDAKTPGFGIRINGNSKSWIVMYGKSRRLKTIGRYPDMPLSLARRRALVLLGTQPEPSTAPTFPDARDAYLEAHRKAVSPRVAEESERLLKKHFPWAQSLDKITYRDVADVIDRIDAPSTAQHALKELRTFFNWCVPRYIPHSPVTGIKAPQRYVPRSRILTDKELVAVWNAATKLGYPFGTITKLLLLTGQRKSEIGELKWSYISGHLATLPQNKSQVPHIFPLPQMAQELIASIPKTPSPYLFFNSRDPKKPYQGYGFHKTELDKLSAVRGATIHDWRRTVASGLQRAGIRIEVTEALLGHVSGRTSGIVRVYQTYDYAKEKAEALDLWQAHIQQLLK